MTHARTLGILDLFLMIIVVGTIIDTIFINTVLRVWHTIASIEIDIFLDSDSSSPENSRLLLALTVGCEQSHGSSEGDNGDNACRREEPHAWSHAWSRRICLEERFTGYSVTTAYSDNMSRVTLLEGPKLYI